jgi:hypothetical protein
MHASVRVPRVSGLPNLPPNRTLAWPVRSKWTHWASRRRPQKESAFHGGHRGRLSPLHRRRLDHVSARAQFRTTRWPACDGRDTGRKRSSYGQRQCDVPGHVVKLDAQATVVVDVEAHQEPTRHTPDAVGRDVAAAHKPSRLWTNRPMGHTHNLSTTHHTCARCRTLSKR